MKVSKAAWCAVSCVVALSCALPAYAIVPGQESPNFTGEWSGMNWDGVYNWRGFGGVGVDPYWMLTARHISGSSGNTMSVGGQTYTAQEVLYAPGNADLALVRFDKALPHYYDIYTGTSTALNGSDVILIGFGLTGQDKGSYYEPTIGTSGIKRWGTNKITGKRDVDSAGLTSECLTWFFSDKTTAYEAGLANLDSGSGAFAKVGGEWLLAGINAYVWPQGSGYNENAAVAVGKYSDWIDQQIPEPGTMALVATGAAALVSTRKRRKQQK